MKILEMKDKWQMIRSHIFVIFVFLILSVAYFAPILEGKQIRQGDVEKFQGMSHELKEYYDKEGVSSLWTGSMFSGMPAYTIGVWGDTPHPLDVVEKPFKAMGSKDMGVLFMSMLTSYFLFLLLGAKIPIAVLGAIAFSFSSYSIIILEAGHITKAWAMAYMPLVVAGFLLILRHKYFYGGGIFALALALQIKSNHIQITYYLALFCCIVYVGYAYRYIFQKRWRTLGLTFLTLLVAVCLSALCNLGNLYTNYESAHESIRGKSELTQNIDGKNNKSGGLDKDYAFAWSYGVGETFTLLIPDFYGGASGGSLSENSHLAKVLRSRGYQVPSPLQTYTYWGEQPFTSGPVYFGAIVCFLFVLSFWVVRNSLKWWILGAVVFFVFLSWGRHFDAFNTFFFHYLPFYNKFRTVSMALVIPQLAFVIMAVWTLVEMWQNRMKWEVLRKPILYTLYITGGLCLLFGLFLPFDFTSTVDSRYGMPEWYWDALRADRASLLRMDAIRSLFFILMGVFMLYQLIKKQKKYAIWVLVVLVLVDLWSVDKRYLNGDDFVEKNAIQQIYQPSIANQMILKDKSPSYRVLSLNDPFNDSHVSYFHKSIGGYSAAKLRRYQELIDLRIMPEIRLIGQAFTTGDIKDIQEVFAQTPVLNMLNMRYLIFDPSRAPIVNSYAYGNAWFVDEVCLVENADEEMSFLKQVNPQGTAVVDERFAELVDKREQLQDSSASVVLTDYKPNRLMYEYNTSKDGIIVFSEIYYPYGWQAYIDGMPVPHFRANWILRGMEVPAGKHCIEFSFEPKAYYMTRKIAVGTSSLLLLLILGMIIYKMAREEKTTEY